MKQYLTNDDVKFLLEISNNLDKVTSFEWNLKLLKVLNNPADFISQFSVIFEKYIADLEDKTIKKSFQNVIKEFSHLNYEMSLTSLADLFEVFKPLGPELKDYFYESDFRYRITNSIIKSYRTLDKSSLQPLIKIYTLFYDEILLLGCDTNSMCQQLILKQSISFSDILNNFNLDKENAEKLFQIWVDSEISMAVRKENIIKFDIELGKMTENSYNKYCCDMFCAKCFSICKRGGNNFINYIVVFGECQSEDLKESYIYLCYQNFIKD